MGWWYQRLDRPFTCSSPTEISGCSNSAGNSDTGWTRKQSSHRAKSLAFIRAFSFLQLVRFGGLPEGGLVEGGPWNDNASEDDMSDAYDSIVEIEGGKLDVAENLYAQWTWTRCCHKFGNNRFLCSWPTLWLTQMFLFFLPRKFTFSPQSVFYSLFLNEDSRIRKNISSKLHYRFQRCTSLIKRVQLEFQCLPSYDGLLEMFRPNFEEDHHNFPGIEIQAKLS